MMMDMGMTSLYDDTTLHTIMKPRKPSPSVNEMKRSMKLDLNSLEGGQPIAKKLRAGTPASAMVLSSPDLHMLKLASPDLEKFLITNLGVTTATPTPTQYFFPKNVSAEQEGFAKGFVAALTELRQRDGDELIDAAAVPSVGAIATVATTGPNHPIRVRNVAGAGLPNTVSSSSTVIKMEQNGEPRVLTVLNPVSVHVNPMGAPPTTSIPSSTSAGSGRALFIPTITSVSPSPMLPQTLQSPPPHLATMVNPNLIQVKEESEMVPSPGTASDSMQSSSWCGTPPLSPIDMEMQEKVKLERKRARNRVAAMKCRQRKLERISVLEGRVSELKHTNQDLQMTADKLRQEVIHLKNQIMQHVNAGCQIVAPGSLPR